MHSAAEQGRAPILEALIADPRVDVLTHAMELLMRPDADSDDDSEASDDEVPLPEVSKRLLTRQPSVLRALALPRGDAPAVRPQVLTADDASAIGGAAWRRRRAAVLAYYL